MTGFQFTVEDSDGVRWTPFVADGGVGFTAAHEDGRTARVTYLAPFGFAADICCTPGISSR